MGQFKFKAIGSVFKLLDVNQDGNIERTELREAFVKYSALASPLVRGRTSSRLTRLEDGSLSPEQLHIIDKVRCEQHVSQHLCDPGAFAWRTYLYSFSSCIKRKNKPTCLAKK